MFPIVFTIALACGFFLFWRAARHELIEPETAFDLAIVGALGALVLGRLMEFAVRAQDFEWSLARLVFVNVWRGFDFYGALLGAGVAFFIFARRHRLEPLLIFDLAAPPLVFFQALITLGKYLLLKNLVWLAYFALNLVIFWVMKRLAKKKRRAGFFAGFYLVTLSILDIFLFFAKPEVTNIGRVPYEFVAPIVILQATLVIWWAISGRQIARDLSDLLARSLLAIMRVKRMITDANEAGKFSRSIILAPVWLARSITLLLKLVGREIYWGTRDFLTVLGVRR